VGLCRKTKISKTVIGALLVMCACGAASPAPARAPARSVLERRVDAAIAEHRGRLPKTAVVQVAVRDLPSGKLTYVRGKQRPVNLASVTKVLTAAAALDLLGPGRSFRTRVLALEREGDHAKGVLLVGGGDPALSEGDLAALAAAVAREGIKQTDEVAAVPLPFGPALFPPGFESKDEDVAYRAPVGGLSLERNRVLINLRPGPKKGSQVLLKLRPYAPGVRIHNNAKTARGKKDRVGVEIDWSGEGLPSIKLHGTLGSALKGGVTGVRLNRYPERWAAETFRALLKDQGVKVPRSAVVRAEVPEGAVPVAKHDSSSLAEIARQTLQHSENQLAEVLLLSLSKDPGRGFEGGLERLRAWVAALGPESSAIRVENGSGLYDGGFGSAVAVTSVLASIYERKGIGAELQSALAQPGKPGTLRKRLRDLPQGSVRAKTGTLDEVSTLCGYVNGAEGDRAFCVLCSGLKHSALGAARALQDAVVRALLHKPTKKQKTARGGRKGG
jgi:serine-type D-Ala-D-Ala carboxypeptidase/endopeptidase (penicillin-binding protein 4)